MATVDLRTLPSDELVLHFGGRPNEVDAFTFSNSLLALSEAMREINRQLSPDQSVEIAIEALDEGSFRAKVKTKRKGLLERFKFTPGEVVAGVLAAMIYESLFGAKPPVIIINDDSYIVESGGDRIILPKNVWDARQRLSNPDAVQKHIAKTFEVLEDDPSVTEFGIASNIHDQGTLGEIPRDEFPRLAIVPSPVLEDDSRRHDDKRTKLVILKAIFERSERRWQFVWNGIKISAPIKSEEFFDKLAAREYEFGQGDILDVDLRVFQTRDEITGAFINERYEVIRVYGVEHAPKQQRFPL